MCVQLALALDGLVVVALGNVTVEGLAALTGDGAQAPVLGSGGGCLGKTVTLVLSVLLQQL